jgi:hypothetical protein
VIDAIRRHVAATLLYLASCAHPGICREFALMVAYAHRERGRAA